MPGAGGDPLTALNPDGFAGYPVDETPYDNPGTDTTLIKALPENPQCTVRPQTVFEVQKMRKNSLVYARAMKDEAVLMAKRKAYINPELAAEAKAKGNEHFKAGSYPDAIKQYNEAIERNPDDDAFTSRIYSNRSACYTKLGEFPHALKDAESTIKTDPKFIKGYLRKANCLKAMQRWDEATKAYDEALGVDPTNGEAQQGKGDVRTAKYGAQAGMTREQRAAQDVLEKGSNGKCGSVRIRLIPAPRGSGVVGSPTMKKLLAFAGIADCFSCSCGHTRTKGNFMKGTFEALRATYCYLTPDLWKPTHFVKPPFQEWSDYLSQSKPLTVAY